ncbi:MAG: Hsp20/alpha crystallin family protein [Candidatus Spechtbacterales bacterium]
MPNFFKKLTSSFKMGGEDDIFNDDSANEETPEEKIDESAGAEKNEENQEGNESEVGEALDVEEEEESSPEPEEEERPYTIAQLAKTQTAGKKIESKSYKTNESPINIYSKREPGENESNIPEGQLAIDVYETPSEIVIKSTIAGAKPDELDIGIEDSTVNIRGSRHNEEKVKGENYLYQECYWGTFSRSIILPTEVDSDKAEASLRDGVLTIRIPKLIKERERKIKVVA